eukprot:jgi/Undpi1/9663/HiC_scaffold_27.g12119.m1
MLVLALHQNPAKQHQHNCCNKNTATRNKNTAARNKNTAAARNKNTAATLNKNTATRNNYYSKINNTDKMNDISRTIKINFEGSSREVSLSTPATLAGLQAAVASAFGVKLAARSRAAGVADTDLSFTYMDSDGDDIVFDKDSELRLALRLCPSPLEISAASKQQVKDVDKPEEAKRLYRRAARNLREYHGVPSMTPPKLVQTLTFLKLHPRRLVNQGLAPKQLLAGVEAPQPLGSDSNDDLAEAIGSDIEVTSVEDDRKEWNDGFEHVGDREKPKNDAGGTANADVEPETDYHGAAARNSSSSEEEASSGSDGVVAGKKKGAPKHVDMMHKAFVSAGIELRPREVIPLLLALGVSPRRLVKLGRVDDKELKKAMLENVKHRRPHHRYFIVSRGMGLPCAHGGGPGALVGYMVGAPGRRGDGSRGLDGKPCGSGGKPCGPGGKPCGPGGKPCGPGGKPCGPGGKPCGPGGKPCGPGGKPFGLGGKPCGPGRRSGGRSSMGGMIFFPPPPLPRDDPAGRGGVGAPGGFCGPHRHGRPGHPGRYGGTGGGSPFSAETMAWMEGRGALPAAARHGRGGCGGRAGGSGGGGNGRHWYGYWG